MVVIEVGSSILTLHRTIQARTLGEKTVCTNVRLILELPLRRQS